MDHLALMYPDKTLIKLTFISNVKGESYHFGSRSDPDSAVSLRSDLDPGQVHLNPHP